MRTNIKYSPDKMWYIASFVRGMSVDEAVKQLSFVLKKGATHVKEVILEAQEMAVRQHNVEYKSNLWIGKQKNLVFQGKIINFLLVCFFFQLNPLWVRDVIFAVYVAMHADVKGELSTNIVTISYA